MHVLTRGVQLRAQIAPYLADLLAGELRVEEIGGLLEQCDWAALAAPKPVMFQHGIKDAPFCPGADEELLDLKWNTGILPHAEYDAMFAEIERAWRLAAPKETEPQVQSHIHDGAHKVDNEAAFAWLTRWVADLE